MIKSFYYINSEGYIIYPPQNDLTGLTPYVQIMADPNKILYNKNAKQYLTSPANVILGIDNDIIEVPLDKTN